MSLHRKLDDFRNFQEAKSTGEEGGNRLFIGRIEGRRRGAPACNALRASFSEGNRVSSGASKVSWPMAARSSRSTGVLIRSGQAKA